MAVGEGRRRAHRVCFMCQRREERPSSIQLWIAAVESVMKFGSAPQSTIDSEVAGCISGAGTVCPQRSPARLDTALRP
jgi:hypothetical protein